MAPIAIDLVIGLATVGQHTSCNSMIWVLALGILYTVTSLPRHEIQIYHPL